MTADELRALPPDQLWATLRAELGLTKEQIADGCGLPTEATRLVWLQGMSDLDFTKPGTPAWQLFVDALPIVGQLIGLATGAAGLGAALRAL